ncbi:uncharacterized protein LOC141937688 [Strix uralensis]|uniref:uncharacterized protein LOC141937688 n=1 Tax=Strix uralensis TaxID=36305 RepID=UPI003DA6EBDA
MLPELVSELRRSFFVRPPIIVAALSGLPPVGPQLPPNAVPRPESVLQLRPSHRCLERRITSCVLHMTLLFIHPGAEESCNLPRSVKPCLTSTPTSICVLLETLGRRWNKDGTNGFNSTGPSVPLVTQPIYSSAVLRCPCGPIRQRYHLLKAAHDEATCLCCNQGDVQRMRVKDSCARRWRSRSLPGASTRGWWEQPTLEED